MPVSILLHERRGAASEHFAGGKISPEGGFTSARGMRWDRGLRKSSAFAGGQVRLPIDQLKSYLAEKLAY